MNPEGMLIDCLSSRLPDWNLKTTVGIHDKSVN